MGLKPGTGRPAPVSLFIDPVSYHFERDRLFDLGAAPLSGDSILAPFVHVRDTLAARGIPVHTADQLLGGEVSASEINVYVSMGAMHRYRKLA